VIGSGTARADDPRLTARGVGAARQPLRVVCDTRLALSRRLRLLRSPLARGTVVACGKRAPARAASDLTAAGVRVWRLPGERGGVSLRALLRRLGREGVQEVLVEGGSKLAGAFLAARLVDRLAVFTAPRVMGAASLAWGGPLRRPLDGRVVETRRLGDDLMWMLEMEA